MAHFPPGGWGLEDLVDVSDWARQLQDLEGSRSARKIILDLKDLSARIARISIPLEFDEEASNAGEDEEAFVPVKAERSSIRVRNRETVPVRADDLVGTIENDTKVG
jgi:hypothetical protein